MIVMFIFNMFQLIMMMKLMIDKNIDDGWWIWILDDLDDLDDLDVIFVLDGFPIMTIMSIISIILLIIDCCHELYKYIMFIYDIR